MAHEKGKDRNAMETLKTQLSLIPQILKTKLANFSLLVFNEQISTLWILEASTNLQNYNIQNCISYNNGNNIDISQQLECNLTIEHTQQKLK